MNCPKCGSTLFKGQCLSCEMRRAGMSKSASLYSPTTREIPPPDQTTAEVVAWLTERCPHRVSPYGGNVEMEMPRDGRSLGPRMDEPAAETGRARFDMLEIED